MKPLALTMGEPAGISGEITLKSWMMRHGKDVPAFVYIGDPDYLRAQADHLNIRAKVEVIQSLDDVDDLFETALPVLNLPLKNSNQNGVLDPANAFSVIESIEEAARLSLEGKVAGLVTNPIHKGALYGAGFEHPGHTEFIAHLCAGHGAARYQSVMMLMAQNLRVVPLSVHIPIKDVADAITSDLITNKARIVAEGLRVRFGVENPRIAICGLNPHAGEGGSIGSEDIDVILPAIEALQAEGMQVSGPHSADTLFHERARENYDVALCMYHDQALIPVKTIDFYGGVNVTLGLPIIRTSPDHGTALEIAGRGNAHPDSLIAALKAARGMANT